jgi:hypothetical protein
VGSTSLTFERDPGVVTTNTAQTISAIKTFSAAPVFGAGLTASGAVSNDFSGGTGTFKTSSGTNTISGNLQMASGKVAGFGAKQSVSTAGATAANVTTRTTWYDLATAANNITSTLADGSVTGQRKSLVCATASSGKTVAISPTHFVDGTSISLSAAHDSAELEFDGTNWFVVHLTGTASVS